MTASVIASPGSAGRTRCTTLRSAPPISLRETPDGLYLVASGAGPVGGDDLDLEVHVDIGASLLVRSAAASMVLPGPAGERSSLTVRARVDGVLTWLPEPTVLVTGCDHRTMARIELGAEATLMWRETVVLGRHGEPSGSLLQQLHVDRDGYPLLRNDVLLGPVWPASDGPAGTGGADVVTSTLVVGGAAPADPADGRGAVLQLADDAWLVSALRTRRPLVDHQRSPA